MRGIDAWHHKYEQNLWRPVVGIRQECRQTAIFWAPLGAPQTNGPRGTLTPPLPRLPVGHATFGAALMQALRLGLNTGAGPITVQDVLASKRRPTGDRGRDIQFRLRRTRRRLQRPRRLSPATRAEKEFKSFAEPVWENSGAASTSACTGASTASRATPRRTSAACPSASPSARKRTTSSTARRRWQAAYDGRAGLGVAE